MNVIVVLVGVFFAGMGVFALAAPAALARPFRIVVEHPESRSEIRAVYGGFGVATAAALGLALISPGLHDGILTAVGCALAGMALGRVVSRVLDRPTAFYPIWFYALVEIVAAGLLATVVLTRASAT
ncbi:MULTISPECIES: DUF4345 domain-containing protein [Pseudonocardia]|uniref:DUF4345 domain-containing protein n=2 Tax=Pseudonocardia TaxID=1847 RepID=A0A1Y2MP41_PSEAH|nr:MULTISPECIES: DUF4345 domain-containing protein [Pseudonocardia]OSY36942.1 hypothetical protein BG845_05025 [Pseudonocardia autotrophica]TDN75625.1 uncharacterized protein DUF4345 [Pseudonocardia autotrophica]BBF99596.1 membrane protein [Pseudonocardia autotrophica]GEC28615.1 membrane protein [Pseudonocardia saturnea]